MSGGHWNYVQTSLKYVVANDILDLAEHETDPEVKKRMLEAVELVRRAAYAIQRVDWLVSGDDDTESFIRRWDNPEED